MRYQGTPALEAFAALSAGLRPSRLVTLRVLLTFLEIDAALAAHVADVGEDAGVSDAVPLQHLFPSEGFAAIGTVVGPGLLVDHLEVVLHRSWRREQGRAAWLLATDCLLELLLAVAGAHMAPQMGHVGVGLWALRHLAFELFLQR